jgi:hypothetical protein
MRQLWEQIYRGSLPGHQNEYSIFDKDGIVNVSEHLRKVLINRKHRGYTAVEYKINPIIGKRVSKPGYDCY